MTTKTEINPREHDEMLASMIEWYGKLKHDYGAALVRLYQAVGGEQVMSYEGRKRMWRWMYGDEPLTPALARKLVPGNPGATNYGPSPAEALAKLDEILAEATALEEEIDAAESEYTGWSRYFVVTSSNGHIHNTRSCSTCYASTTYGWLPHLSGKSEDEAIEFFGPAAECLCSVCFPDAPVRTKDGNLTVKERTALLMGQTPEPRATYCEGSGQWGEEPKRLGYYSGNWATCPVCHKRVTTTTRESSKLRKHKAEA